MRERKIWDQVVRLKKGLRYDVADLDVRLVEVYWTPGYDNRKAHEGYDWGYYFADDGTYLGPDRHGIEPEFAVMDDEPIALAVESKDRPVNQ